MDKAEIQDPEDNLRKFDIELRNVQLQIITRWYNRADLSYTFR